MKKGEESVMCAWPVRTEIASISIVREISSEFQTIDSGRNRRQSSTHSDASSGIRSFGTPNLLALIQIHRLRLEHFSEKQFLEPSWPMLLELLEGHETGKVLPVSSLYQVRGVPITTALRRLDDLERDGLIVRYPDPSDRRRTLVRLADKGVVRMLKYFGQVQYEIDRYLTLAADIFPKEGLKKK